MKTPDDIVADVAGAILNIITGPDLMTGQVIALEGGMLHANFNPR